MMQSKQSKTEQDADYDESFRLPQRSAQASGASLNRGAQCLLDRERVLGPAASTTVGFGLGPAPRDSSYFSSSRELEQRRRQLSLALAEQIGNPGNVASVSDSLLGGADFRSLDATRSSAGPDYELLLQMYRQRNSPFLANQALDLAYHQHAELNPERNAALLANMRQEQQGHSSAFGDALSRGCQTMGALNEASLLHQPLLSERISRLSSGIERGDAAALLRDRPLAEARLIASLRGTARLLPSADRLVADRVSSSIAPFYEALSLDRNSRSSGICNAGGLIRQTGGSTGAAASPRSSSSSAESSVAVSEALQKIKKPPRPLTSYNIFFKEIRLSINAAGDGNLSFTAMGKHIGSRWKALSDEEKRPYMEKAKVEKDRHKLEMDEYNRRREDVMSTYHSTQLRSVNDEVMSRYYEEHQSKSAPKRRKFRS